VSHVSRFGPVKIPDILANYLSSYHQKESKELWDKTKWNDALSSSGMSIDYIEQIPDGLGRTYIADEVSSLLAQGEYIAALALVLLWGYNRTQGYGPYRLVNWVLDKDRNSDIEHHLRSTVDLLLSQDIYNPSDFSDLAFRAYRTVEYRAKDWIFGLGPSYFTKWFYFVTAKGNPKSKNALPIMDEKTLHWISSNTHININTPSAHHYQLYSEVLQSWGAEYGLSAGQVEQAIFELETETRQSF